MKIVFLSFFMLCCICATPAASIEREPAELMLTRAMESLMAGQESVALATLQQTIQSYPNFRLARMIYADLYAVRSQLPPLLSETRALSKARIADLSAEARARLNYQPPAADRLPSNIVKLSPMHRYALLFDAQHSRLYLFANNHGKLRLLSDYYAASGRGGMNKQSEGDNRTPNGSYTITQVLEDEQLPELYGRYAYTLNYPNRWDRIQARDGYGIWLHGVPRMTYSRPPEASRGCIVISNQAIDALHSYMQAGTTPMLLATEVTWLRQQQWSLQQQELLDVVRQWQTDWQSLNVEKYLAHYSKDYLDQKYNHAQFVKSSRKNAQKKTFVKVTLTEIDLMLYSSEPNLFLARFNQDYRSNNYNIAYRKQQMWQLESDGWKIVFEGRV